MKIIQPRLASIDAHTRGRDSGSGHRPRKGFYSYPIRRRVPGISWQAGILRMTDRSWVSWQSVLILLLSGFICFHLSLAAPAWPSDTVDNRLYAELLDKYVKNGVVNYQGFKNEESKLDQYLEVLEQVDTGSLSRNEQFAFYINAYNAWTIKLILSRYPDLQSIKDLGSIFQSPWKKKISRIDGKLMTLDQIEHNILRPRFKDPRVHFAINCASKSCPPLISEPYRGNTLDQQLDHSVRAFINDPKSNRLEGNELYVSRIFKWFREDFNNDVLGFFLEYARGDFKKRLEAKREEIKIRYLDYDWSLNGY